MRHLIGLIVFVLFGCGNALALDWTGIWAVDRRTDVFVLIDREDTQDDGATRIVLVNAKSIGLRFDWYMFNGHVGDGTDASAFEAYYYEGSDTSGRQILDIVPASISVPVNDSRATLTLQIDGTIVTLPMARAQPTKGWLNAPIDTDAPEPGFYRSAGVTPLVFLEAQDKTMQLFVLGQGADNAPSHRISSLKKQSTLLWADRKSRTTVRGQAATGLRFDLEQNGTTVTLARSLVGDAFFVPEDFGSDFGLPDDNHNGVRDDVEAYVRGTSVGSARVRSAAMAYARALGTLVAGGTTSQSAAADLDTVRTASTCVNVFATREGSDPIAIVRSMLTNTSARRAALAATERTTGRTAYLLPTVAPDYAPTCRMPGVYRAIEIPDKDAGPVRIAPAVSARATGPVVTNVCTDTAVIYVSGVFTDEAGAVQSIASFRKTIETDPLAAALGLSVRSLEYRAVWDENPGLNDVAQFMMGSMSETDAYDFTYSRFGFLRIGLSLVRGVLKHGVYTIDKYVMPAPFQIALQRRIALLVRRENDSEVQFLKSVVLDQIAAGRRVILLSHSRGNVRSRAAMAALDANKARHVRIVPVANAARENSRFPPGTTRDDDKIMTLTQNLFSSTRSTVFGAGYPYDLLTRHFFEESYLANSKTRRAVLQDFTEALATPVPTATRPPVIGGRAGGFTGEAGEIATFEIGTAPNEITIKYNAYNIADRFAIYYRGRMIATTGNVSGTGKLTARIPVDLDGRTGRISVGAFGTTQDTKWTYEIVCPG